MSQRWPNFKFSVEGACIDLSPNSVTVSSAGRIYGDESYLSMSDVKQVKYHDEYFNVKVMSRDIGPNDDILYVLEYLINVYKTYKEVDYFRLKVDDLKNNSCREFTKGLPPTTYDTIWVMRVLDNKIVLCNGLGEVFILTYNETQDQLNLECSFSLPSIDIPRGKLQNIRMQPYMCVTDKHEVIIARSHGKEVYICPITEEGQIEGMIRVPLQQHETESEVCGVAFDVTHKEDIVILRKIRHLDSRFQIEIYSRNGVIQNIYPLPGSASTGTCYLLSNPKGVVAVIQKQHLSDLIRYWHLVGKVSYNR